MENTKSVEILLVGHLTLDEDAYGLHLGGSVFFASQLLRILKYRANIVTSYDRNTFTPILDGNFNINVVKSSSTTTFANYYKSGEREQRVRYIASRIAETDIPENYLNSDLVFLAPVIGEIGLDVVSLFKTKFVVANLQGWLREFNKSGLVNRKIIDLDEILEHVDVAIISQEDIKDWAVLEDWANKVNILVVTNGSGGCNVSVDNKWHHIPGIKVVEIDPVGAGDIFATAYMVKYFQTSDFLQAAIFANCIAGISVEGQRIAKLTDSLLIDACSRN
jgi:hypothetical protein